MATKTVVCPECGATAGPGRYACEACGSLLAAIGAAPRVPAGIAEPVAEPVDAVAEPVAPVAEPVDEPVAGDPDAPAAAAPSEPLQPSIAGAAAPGDGPSWRAALADGPSSLPVPPARAGSYLAPSAILDGLTPPEPRVSTAIEALPTVGWLDLAADGPRRVIAIGAALAGLGFALPWANVLAGAGLLGGYFTQWGVAGPGHWIVVGLLVGLAVLALAGGDRLASLPIGLAAVAVSTLLLGLAWPYLFGFLGRSVGLWTVLAGAIILAVGGALDLRGHHAPTEPRV